MRAFPLPVLKTVFANTAEGNDSGPSLFCSRRTVCPGIIWKLGGIIFLLWTKDCMIHEPSSHLRVDSISHDLHGEIFLPSLACKGSIKKSRVENALFSNVP